MYMRSGRAWMTIALVAGALGGAGCSSGGGPGGGGGTLLVVSVNPVASAESVPINAPVTVVFSAAVDPASVTAATFTVKSNASSVAGTLDTAGAVVTFTPGADLSPTTAYSVTLEGGAGGIRGVDGAALAVDRTWTFTTGTSAIVEVTGGITASTTWRSGRIYLVASAIDVTATLTIEPGVVVKMGDGAWISVKPPGAIAATGTPGNEIVFTSWKDDAHGGDTNRDGAATAPAKGDWWEVELGSSGSTFSSCEFWYGGSGYATYDQPTLDLSTYRATVDGCTFAFNCGGTLGSAAGALAARSAASGTVITNNVFYGNDVPLTIGDNFGLDDTNTFHDPADASRKNTYDGIFYGGASITAARTWRETEVPFVVMSSSLELRSALTVANGVVVKMGPASEVWVYDDTASGALIVDSGAAFTSLKDDARGGDTNADLAATSPAAGDWGGIWHESTNGYGSFAYAYYDPP